MMVIVSGCARDTLRLLQLSTLHPRGILRAVRYCQPRDLMKLNAASLGRSSAAILTSASCTCAAWYSGGPRDRWARACALRGSDRAL